MLFAQIRPQRTIPGHASGGLVEMADAAETTALRFGAPRSCRRDATSLLLDCAHSHDSRVRLRACRVGGRDELC